MIKSLNDITINKSHDHHMIHVYDIITSKSHDHGMLMSMTIDQSEESMDNPQLSHDGSQVYNVFAFCSNS